MFFKIKFFQINTGGWTFEFWDYYQVNITSKVDSPELAEMGKIVDPLCKTENAIFIY